MAHYFVPNVNNKQTFTHNIVSSKKLVLYVCLSSTMAEITEIFLNGR